MQRRRKNKRIIALSYGLVAMNCLITWALTYFHEVGILGLVMAIMVPVSYNDPREEMQSNFSTWTAIIMEFLINAFIPIAWSIYWLHILTVLETLFLIVLYIKSYK